VGRVTSSDDVSKAMRLAELARYFTPSTPVSTVDLFAGRFDQIVQILSVLNQPGRHVVLYGERGVGKTSLANLLADFGTPSGETGNDSLRSTRINCSTKDTYKSIWIRVFKDLDIDIPEAWSYGAPDPDEVRLMLANVPGRRIIILDEFDRWEDDEGLSLMADTIKSLSDHAVATRIVIVGVADSLDELVGEHESIQRNLEQVPMPRMTADELQKIPVTGFNRCNMTVGGRALALIVNLSEGLPHYAHYLSFHAGQRAVQDDRATVKDEDVLEAVKVAVKGHTVLSEYKRAIHAQRTGTLHERVLLACALARKDELGYFTAADVREPMSELMGRPYEIPAFSPHLKAFTETERGIVLKREGPERRFRYRFRNPLIQPFAILQALAKDQLPEQYRGRLYATPEQLEFNFPSS